MKRVAYLVFILFFYCVQLSAQTLSEIRSIFYEAVKDPSLPENYTRIKAETKSTLPLINAYIGGLKTMMANTVSNPYKKLSYFNSGKEMIEKAVAENTTEWEIRFVRFMIQCKIPAFLFYENFKEDKKIILEALQNINSTDAYVKKIAIQFLVDSGKLNTNELKSLKN